MREVYRNRAPRGCALIDHGTIIPCAFASTALVFFARRRRSAISPPEYQCHTLHGSGNDLTRFKAILHASVRWNDATILREYLAAVEAHTTAAGNPPTEEFKSWLTWSEAKAEWYDPLTDQPDLLLQNVDKETLSLKRAPSSF